MHSRTFLSLALLACANLALGCADVVDGSRDPIGGTGGAGGMGGGGMGGAGGMGGRVLTCADEGQPCGSDIGECVAGVVDCEGGTPLCAGEVEPINEVCDGLDNNCNGYIDEGLGETSSDALGGGFGNVAEMEAVGDDFALLARVNGSDSLYKFTSAGALAGAVAIGGGDTVGPDMVPLDGEDVLLTRGLPTTSTEVEVRRASFAGANPALLGAWLTVKDTGLSSLGVGTRPVRADGSHVAVVFAVADGANDASGVRFVDTPALPASADASIASDTDNVFDMDLVAPSDPDAPLIFVYRKDGEIRLVQLDRNDLGTGIDLPVATGSSTHLAASTDDKVALAFKSPTDRLSLVVFNAKTMQCVSSPSQTPSSCVTDTGALTVRVTDLVFNGQHWFAGFGTPSGWGLRGFADDGVEVASHTDASRLATSGVVLASQGDGSVMVASDVDDGAFETRIFECN